MFENKTAAAETLHNLLELPKESVIKGPQGLEVQAEHPKAAIIAAKAFKKARARLVCSFAAEEKGSVAIRHIFSIDRPGVFFTVRTEAENNRCTSITPQIPAAHAFERETMEFFGIEPSGHHDTRGLLLHDDWPADIFPLRKSFKSGEKPPRTGGRTYNFLRVEGDGVFEIPVGPVHAGVIEPGHFRFSVAGEPIINLEVRLGYVHKGIEKLAEGKTAEQALKIAERISGDASFSHGLAFCQAAETASGTHIPERAAALRTIFAELERLYNHLGDVAGIATDAGFPFGAAQALILRERVLARNNELCGHRLLRGINVIGGTTRDITGETAISLSIFIADLAGQAEELETLYRDMDTLMDRVCKTGRILKTTAADLGAVGPAARASGVDLDMRRDHPYAFYGQIPFKIALQSDGDVCARMTVKFLEIEQSCAIIRRTLDKMPDGPIAAQPALPRGKAMGWAESSRGEILHWVSFGEDGLIDRLKIKSPSFVNWPLMPRAVRGDIVPDFPLVNKSLNLSYSGNDR